MQENNQENQNIESTESVAARDVSDETADKNEEFEKLRNQILSGIDELEETVGEKIKRKNKKSPLKAIIFACVIVLISVGLASGILLTAAEIMGIGGSQDIIQVEIPKGASTQAIAEILKQNKIIRSVYLFRFVAKNEESKFNYGIFTLSDNMSYGQIFEKLEEVSPITDEISFTIIEGDTLQTIARKLERKNLCTAKGFLNVVNDAKFGYSFEDEMDNDPLIFYHAEGYVFPDTYRLYKGMTAEEIVKVFYGNFNNKITAQMRDRMLEMHMTLSDTITLASIIQAEAGDIKNMKKVSGVFHNRLNNASQYPRLESDPTKKYVKNVIKANSDESNRTREIAYDTYEGVGLTPGPICNPGLDAINAALNPDTSGNYYYFCANIKTKQFYYANTLAQHIANLRKAGLI